MGQKVHPIGIRLGDLEGLGIQVVCGFKNVSDLYFH